MFGLEDSPHTLMNLDDRSVLADLPVVVFARCEIALGSNCCACRWLTLDTASLAVLFLRRRYLAWLPEAVEWSLPMMAARVSAYK